MESFKFTASVKSGALSRVFTIPSDATFEDLSEVIQVTMGWANIRHHRFIVGDMVLQPPSQLEGDKDDYPENEYLLSDFDSKSMRYEYGTKDEWKLYLKRTGKVDTDDRVAHLLSLSGYPPGELMTPDDYNKAREANPEPEGLDSL